MIVRMPIHKTNRFKRWMENRFTEQLEIWEVNIRKYNENIIADMQSKQKVYNSTYALNALLSKI